VIASDTLRIVAVGLLLIAGTVVLGALILTGMSKTIPDALIALGSAALASAGSILVTGGGREVTVTNTADDPVPVDAG
jgi:hypothetical protein